MNVDPTLLIKQTMEDYENEKHKIPVWLKITFGDNL